MPNEIKYTNVSLANGERVATNGYYTGEHKGTVMQDGKYTEANNDAHYVEGATVHLGTITQDAGDTKFPTVVSE